MLLLLLSPAESNQVRSGEETASIVALEQIAIKDGIVQGNLGAEGSKEQTIKVVKIKGLLKVKPGGP
jgi:hypothetical protein